MHTACSRMEFTKGKKKCQSYDEIRYTKCYLIIKTYEIPLKKSIVIYYFRLNFEVRIFVLIAFILIYL